MNTASPLRSASRRGFTLLELTVVIAVLLSLTTVLFFGARAWKSGADRTGCILAIRNVQVSVRSYQNLYGYSPGGMPYAENGTQDIAIHMCNKGYITDEQFAAIEGSKTCPGGGTYEREHVDVFPTVGRLYIGCSLASTKDHVPDEGLEW
ncbi:type II secretion system protein [Luteolibacter marinus]|uniref:type II secretion system protein n=1 Tax=Luteolibacter marinus TaxID=2776705 RepID=UPI0018679784|nr:type II secretion system protein [Luteolibacter marinus]